ncbi:MAG: amidohydrolase family protein [Saprospiraceae bacterium]|nr:amidohydrolase family protein [Saprospiraceae bacterium]
MRKISADFLFPISAAPIEQGVVIVDDDGKILDISTRPEHDRTELEIRKGIIVPGFINTHCHLELSHLKDKLDTGTGLLPFLQSVVSLREFPMEEILDAIEKADREMYDNGIVAVGDISNKIDTAAQKDKSSIRYYTFVEMFDFMQKELAEPTFQQYKEVYDKQSDAGGNEKSCVPHAPYTVSEPLFEMIREVNKSGQTVSIHNQESIDENLLFQNKMGGYPEFFLSFGFELKKFEASGKNSIHYALQNMDPGCRTLFVHNTQTRPEDIRAAHAWSDRVYWTTCPNANLYIENKLPRYQFFRDEKARMTVGTDSLSSNWQLSVLEEMKTIARFQSYIPLGELLQWATLNGAEALGFDDQLGSIEAGKRPGLNLLNIGPEMNLSRDTRVERIA